MSPSLSYLQQKLGINVIHYLYQYGGINVLCQKCLLIPKTNKKSVKKIAEMNINFLKKEMKKYQKEKTRKKEK